MAKQRVTFLLDNGMRVEMNLSTTAGKIMDILDTNSCFLYNENGREKIISLKHVSHVEIEELE